MLPFARITTAICLALFAAALPGAAYAQLSKPQNPAILDIRGAIGVKNATEAAQFDDAMIEAMPKKTIKTKTPWTEGEAEFSGPSLASLLDAVGAKGTVLRITALNNYTIEVPIGDAKEFDPIVATSLNGQKLRVRDRGPLWLIYPWSANSDIQNEKYYNRSIWQIRTIEVR